MTTTTLCYRVIDSPIGPLTLAGTGSTLMHLAMPGQTRVDRARWKAAGPGAFSDVADQLSAYFAGRLADFELDLQLAGTEFQRGVWAAVQTIPYGETRSYGEIAERLGSPAACRAVGVATGRNPIPIIVPCHRVVGSTGALTGYVGGIDCKRELLDLERRYDLNDSDSRLVIAAMTS
ncbi:MAG: methylated-DNA--[protein]-cysteine S-methyltransferase [Mycobacteriaceae bacterium]